MATTTMTAAAGVWPGPFPFPLSVVGTVSGVLTCSVTVTVNGLRLRFQKKKNLDLFPFLGRIAQSDLANEAPEQLLCCTRNFAVVIFFLADATFNKLVAGRTLNFLPDVRG